MTFIYEEKPRLIVQTDLRGDACLIYCTFSAFMKNWPSGDVVFVINGNIVLKCRTLSQGG